MSFFNNPVPFRKLYFALGALFGGIPFFMEK